MKTLLVSFQKGLDALGLRYLHYYLLENGHDSTALYLPLFRCNSKKHRESLRKFVRKICPDLIGVSLMSNEYSAARNLTKLLKSYVTPATIIWGGIHPTISPQDCFPYADYACIGEGEKTILDIATAWDKKENIKNIPNLCYMEEGTIIKNNLYPYIENLDKLPLPDYIPVSSFILTNAGIRKLNKKLFTRYARYSGKVYSTIKSRGCPFSCTYCCNNALSRIYSSRKIRVRGSENIIEEIGHILENSSKVEYINFQDDCFLACSQDKIQEFCQMYKNNFKKPFIIRAIPVFVTREKIRLLKDAGLAWILLGLQSGSDYVCKEIYKRNSGLSDFFKTAGILKEFNIPATYDIITDNPFENEEDRLKTVAAIMKIPKPFFLQCYSLVLYPGTELFERAQFKFPQLCQQHYTRNFMIIGRNKINILIRLAAFINKTWMNLLLSLYKQKQKSAGFTIILSLANIFTIAVLQPITYLRLLKTSQRGSYLKAFRLVLMYSREGAMRYLSQLKNTD